MQNPGARDPDTEVFIPQYKLPVLVYYRPHMYEFLDFLKENFELILFTNSEKVYTDLLLQKIDPENKYFEHKLYQTASYLLDKPDEDIYEYIKDIQRFQGIRDMKKSLLADARPMNYIMSPDNVFMMEEYNAEFDHDEFKDNYLLMAMEELKEFIGAEDLRKVSMGGVSIKDVLRNSKLI